MCEVSWGIKGFLLYATLSSFSSLIVPFYTFCEFYLVFWLAIDNDLFKMCHEAFEARHVKNKQCMPITFLNVYDKVLAKALGD